MTKSKYNTKQHRKNSKNSDNFFSHNTAFGDYGENMAKRVLEDSGYIVENQAKSAFQGDLWTKCIQTGEITKIEVKSASQSHGKYRFCLYKRGHTSHLYCAFVFLVAIDSYGKEFYYLIPHFELSSVTYITINSHPTVYAGRYAKYRVRGQVNLAEIMEFSKCQ